MVKFSGNLFDFIAEINFKVWCTVLQLYYQYICLL